MGGIIDKITDFIKEMLQGWVLSNLSTMFTDVNTKVGTIAGDDTAFLLMHDTETACEFFKKLGEMLL